MKILGIEHIGIAVDDLNKIHNFLNSYLNSFDCFLDEIYFCPHTPEENCACRKPKIGLFEKALNSYSEIDLANSWMIGDSDSDILAGKKFGIRTIKIQSNSSLDESVNQILENYS